MEKDFWKWHAEKSNLNKDKIRPFFHEAEVWFASIGSNIGFEEDGKGNNFLRPIIIIKKFNNEVCWGIPTTKKFRNSKYYFHFEFSQNKYTNAILSQLRLVDSKRLSYKIGSVRNSDFRKMKNRLISYLK